MGKKHKIIVSLGIVLVVLFFLGACGQKEDAPKKPNVVRKKVVKKKVSKPAPKIVKKQEATDTASPSKDVSGEKKMPPSKKSLAEEKQPKTDTLEKKKVSTTTLAAKKKPAFKPKSEISEESDYKEKPASAVKVAKKDDAKAEELPKGPQAEKKSPEIKEGKNEGNDTAPEAIKGTEKPKQDETQKESAEKKDAEGMQNGNNKVAELTPTETLPPVKIDPLNQNYKYLPEGKIDPFSSLFSVKSETKRKQKRFPLTPLEKQDISQFKLVGVILSAKGNKAIVQNSGKGYVISKGTYIGVNDGRVVKILKDRVICEETVENLFGQIEKKARVLKLIKPPGAL